MLIKLVYVPWGGKEEQGGRAQPGLGNLELCLFLGASFEEDVSLKHGEGGIRRPEARLV